MKYNSKSVHRVGQGIETRFFNYYKFLQGQYFLLCYLGLSVANYRKLVFKQEVEFRDTLVRVRLVCFQKFFVMRAKTAPKAEHQENPKGDPTPPKLMRESLGAVKAKFLELSSPTG